MIWDSYSQLDVLLDTRLWGKERRSPKATSLKQTKHSTKRTRSDDAPDLHGTTRPSGAKQEAKSTIADNANPSRRKSARRETFQLEIIENGDDKPSV